MKIMVFGSLNMDHVYRVNRFTAAGETVPSLGLDDICGGKGLNQSIAIQNGGRDVLHAGCVGADDGEPLLQFLQGKGVDTHLISLVNMPSGHTIIQVNGKGENAILLYGGANQAVDEKMIDASLQELDACDLLVMQNEISQMPLLMKKAQEKGVRLVLNPSPIEGVLENFPLHLVDLFFLNEYEAMALAGSHDQVEEALLQKYPGAKFVVTYGAKGAAVISKGQKRLWHDGLSVEAVDTTGAGDTFLGYFISRMAGGAADEECLRYATQAAALCVQRFGAAQAIPLLNEVENELKGK